MNNYFYLVYCDGSKYVERGHSSPITGDYPGVVDGCDVSYGLFNTSTTLCYCNDRNNCNSLKASDLNP